MLTRLMLTSAGGDLGTANIRTRNKRDLSPQRGIKESKEQYKGMESRVIIRWNDLAGRSTGALKSYHEVGELGRKP